MKDTLLIDMAAANAAAQIMAEEDAKIFAVIESATSSGHVEPTPLLGPDELSKGMLTTYEMDVKAVAAVIAKENAVGKVSRPRRPGRLTRWDYLM